jgi:hypothetical protein
MGFWVRFHRRSRWVRWPLKVLVFAAVVLVVLYPKLWLLPRHIARVADLESVLEPANPGLAPFETDVRSAGPETASAKQRLAVVEWVVYRRKPYAFDWDTWGVMNYLPSTAEALAMPRTDCKGRAVVAASLLRRMGDEAYLTADITHMWVVTPVGEIMSPGVGEKTLEGGPQGTQLRLTVGALANLVRGFGFGVAVFPLTRELIIVAALCALSMHPWSSNRRRVVGCLLVLLALGLLHDSTAVGASTCSRPWLGWVGLGVAVVGWITLVLGRRPIQAA